MGFGRFEKYRKFNKKKIFFGHVGGHFLAYKFVAPKFVYFSIVSPGIKRDLRKHVGLPSKQVGRPRARSHIIK